ncbi:hypothetical protein [Clostridium sp.]|uniref:hypothetical protein n=1 Tax=Clostridium sp. TaxID=1506 RepID=UPI003996B2C6
MYSNIAYSNENNHCYYVLIPNCVPKGENLCDYWKERLLFLYSLFLENKENSPEGAMRAAVDSVIKYVENNISYCNGKFEMIKISYSTKLDSKWLYWREIDSISVSVAS